MKKLTSLVALFLMCFGMTMNAQTTVGVDISTATNEIVTNVTDGSGVALEGVTATLATDDNEGSFMFDNAQIGNTVIFSRLFKTMQSKISTLTLTLTGLSADAKFNEAHFALQGWGYKKNGNKYSTLAIERFIDAVCLVNGEEVASQVNIKLKKADQHKVVLSMTFAKEITMKGGSDVVTLKVMRNASDKGADFNIGVTNISLSYKDQAALDAEKFAQAKTKWQAIQGFVGFYSEEDVAAACAKANLAEAEAYLTGCTKVSIEPNQYYRVCNVKNNGHMNVTKDGLQRGSELYLGNVDMLWQFVEGTTGSYKLINANHKKYLALPVKTIVTDSKGHEKDEWKVALADEANALEFQVNFLADAEHTMTFMEGDAKNFLTGNKYFIRKMAAEDGEEKWYIKPVSQIPVEMHKATPEATESWASLYLPFGVQLAEGLEAYTGVVAGNKMNLTAIAEVPANNGVILKGTAEKYTLKIADVAPVAVANDLKGSNVVVSLVDALPEGAEPTLHNAEYYTLGYTPEGGVGMYHPTGDVLKANMVYVEKIAGVNALSFDFGEATGVEGVEVATPADNVYYDLSGRRVAQPVKGLYIVNGKKVYVK